MVVVIVTVCSLASAQPVPAPPLDAATTEPTPAAVAPPTTAPTAPAAAPSEPVEPETERAVCRRAKLYLEPSLFSMNGTTWRTSSGGTMTTSNQNIFHRIAAGGLVRWCSRTPALGGRIGGTAVVNPNISGFGVEAEVDYGLGSAVNGGVRIGIELGFDSRIVSAGGRLHFYDSVFVGLDAYDARDPPYSSHGVMLGFGLEGRAGRWTVVAEAVVVAISFVVLVAGE